MSQRTEKRNRRAKAKRKAAALERASRRVERREETIPPRRPQRPDKERWLIENFARGLEMMRQSEADRKAALAPAEEAWEALVLGFEQLDEGERRKLADDIVAAKPYTESGLPPGVVCETGTGACGKRLLDHLEVLIGQEEDAETLRSTYTKLSQRALDEIGPEARELVDLVASTADDAFLDNARYGWPTPEELGRPSEDEWTCFWGDDIAEFADRADLALEDALLIAAQLARLECWMLMERYGVSFDVAFHQKLPFRDEEVLPNSPGMTAPTG